MPEPIVEQAIAALVTKLKGMTGIRSWGTAYPNNPVVERVYKHPAQVAEYPHLSVLEARGSSFEQEATGSATTAMFLHKVRLTIQGSVKGDDQVLSSTWINRLVDDIRKTLMGDSTLGGVVRDITLDPEYETDEGELDPVGAVLMRLTVVADENVTIG